MPVEFVRTATEDGILTIALARPRANAFNIPFVEELSAAVRHAQMSDSIDGLIFASDVPGFFSAGFDTNEVFGYDAVTMRRFLIAFIDLYEMVLRLSKPVVGALRGHTYAGGAFLALAFDERIAADGAFGFAVNEINLGVFLPPCVQRMLVATVGLHQASRMIMTGEAVPWNQAHSLGLIDEMVAGDDLIPRALERARLLCRKPRAAFAASKQALQQAAGHVGGVSDRTSADDFLAMWFAPESIERRQAVTRAVKR